MNSGAHIRALDGVRGLAIAAVMLYHGWVYTGTDTVGSAIDRARSTGWAGVDLFFVLSGFLITGILLETRDRPGYWRTFLLRRGLRIFPLYYAVLVALLVGGLVMRHIGLGNIDRSIAALDGIWLNFIYLTNFAIASLGENRVPLDIAWSLAIEEQFYLVFPLLVRALSPRRLAYVLCVVLVAAPVLRALVHAYGAQPVLGPYVLPYCRMDALAAGALLRLAIYLDWKSLVAGLARFAPFLCVGALILLYAWPRKDLRFIIVGYTTSSLAAAALIARLLASEPAALLRRVFERPSLVYLGKISYGLYLFHLFARTAATLVLVRVIGGRFGDQVWFCAAQLIAMFGISIVVASVSFAWFERPILRFKDRWAPSAEPLQPPTRPQ